VRLTLEMPRHHMPEPSTAATCAASVLQASLVGLDPQTAVRRQSKNYNLVISAR